MKPLKSFLLLVGITALIIFFEQCRWDKLANPNAPCFETDIQPLINSSCALSGCHDAITNQNGLDLSQTNDIMSLVNPGHAKSSKLYQTITGSEELMPPDPLLPLTQAQIDLIALWIDLGAPVVAGCGNVQAGGCDTIPTPSFANQILPTVISNCGGCHNNSATGGGILLTNYAQVKAQVDNGKFMGSLNHLSGYFPMPKNSAKLRDCQLNIYQLWIDQGAQNN